LALPSDVVNACTNIQQVAEEEEEEKEKEKEGDTPHVDTWHNARVWIEFLGTGLRS
jgi:hypothetical protein